jgi:hypothetical protein
MNQVEKLTPAMFVLVLFLVANARGQERHLNRSDLPLAVRQTADKESKGATIRGYTREIEGGKLEYEVATVANNLTRNVTIEPDGKVVEVEQEVALSALPEAVREGLQQKAGAGRITKVISIKERDALVAYEAKVLDAGKKSEVQVGPDGKVLEVEEEVALNALPAAVRTGLQQKVGAGRITKVASITKRDAVVAYEADVLTAGEKSEVQIGPDGKTLDHQE